MGSGTAVISTQPLATITPKISTMALPGPRPSFPLSVLLLDRSPVRLDRLGAPPVRGPSIEIEIPLGIPAKSRSDLICHRDTAGDPVHGAIPIHSSSRYRREFLPRIYPEFTQIRETPGVFNQESTLNLIRIQMPPGISSGNFIQESNSPNILLRRLLSGPI